MSTRDQDTTTAAPNGSPEISLMRRFLQPRTLISFVVGILILAFAVSHLHFDVAKTIHVIERVNWTFFLLGLLVYYVVFPVRALRWRRMLENTGYERAQLPALGSLSEIIFISWFVNCVVPAKLGDVYRAFLLRQRSAIPVSKGGGTILAERLIDMATLMVMLGLTALVSLRGKLPSQVELTFELGCAGVLMAGIALLVMRRFDSLIRPLLPDGRLRSIYGHFQEGTLGSFGRYPELLTLSVTAWIIEGLRLYFVMRSVGLSLSPSPLIQLVTALFIALGGALLTAIPATPAGLGLVESGLIYGLMLFNAPASVAAAVAFLDRTISFTSIVIFGLIVYLLSVSNKSFLTQRAKCESESITPQR